MDKQKSAAPQTSSPASNDERRGFLSKVAATIIGGIIVIFPFAAGLGPVLDPVLRKKKSGAGSDDFTPLAKLSDLVENGPPKRFQVITDRDDAWSRQPRQPIGAVYLRRIGPEQVQAFTATCPHAGCFIDFKAQSNEYLCPCHQSPFTISGEIIQPSPSPRAMDSLDVEVRKNAAGEDEVYVKFQQFYTGRESKVAKA